MVSRSDLLVDDIRNSVVHDQTKALEELTSIVEFPNPAAALMDALEMIKPNILLLTVDALRFDRLGMSGYRFNTSPVLDSMDETLVV